MAFPQTRQTLIRRIAAGGGDQDWGQFLRDYWQPVCRFAQRRANMTIEDAEDVASQTFEAILTNQLLQRWDADRSSKLRTLLCTVVRHILGNYARVQSGRKHLLRQNAAELIARSDLPTIKAMDASRKQVDAFYVAWVEGVLQEAIDSLMQEYHRTGKGDYFRALYGRVCEGLTTRQVSESLSISLTTAENYYKAARKRLASRLQEQVRRHVERYCDPQDADAEFAAEWGQLGEHIKDHGGLERAIARAHEEFDPVETAQRQTAAITAVVNRLTQIRPPVTDSRAPRL